MKRRDFIIRGTSALLLKNSSLRASEKLQSIVNGKPGRATDSLVGQAVDIASLGNLRSWTNPESSSTIQRRMSPTGSSERTLRLSELAGSGQFDIGVEWPEFRTINKVAIHFTAPDKTPRAHLASLEYWSGLSPLQGEWKRFQDGFLAVLPTKEDGVWEYAFPALRTCKIRLLLQNKTNVELERFAAYGASQWRSGNVRVEWGHSGEQRTSAGRLEIYNGQILSVTPFGGAQLRGPLHWLSTAGKGKVSGIVVGVLYASGTNVDRSILTVRSEAGDYSFLPGEILEGQPILLPDFDVYLRNDLLALEAAEFKKRNAGRHRIRDAVAMLPEQTLANARSAIHAQRVDLSFVGVDSSNQKFGVAPDGHFVVGRGDPRHGKPIMAEYGLFFESRSSSELFEKPASTETLLFHEGVAKRQQLEEGWLPVIVTEWSENDVSFSRTDFGALREMPTNFDDAALRGDEPTVMISRLKIKNDSVIPQMAEYYIKPWKPSRGQMPYRAMSKDIPNAWTTLLHGSFVVVADRQAEWALCYLDYQSIGSLSLDSELGAVKYSVTLLPGDEAHMDLVMPGLPVSFADAEQLRGLDYDRVHGTTVNYWKKLLEAGMNIEVPDDHLQNLFNANLHHLLLALTKDSSRNEHYPNVAMFRYGSIGSESSPMMQAMDMRGIHRRAESCLQAWLSTQGEAQPEGDYRIKEGGFYYFWPGYTIDQGGVLWALAEHYLYTRDIEWLRRVANQIISGCDFILSERRRIMAQRTSGEQPLSYGLAPAGCTADMRDWEYSFMLNGYFYLALKKSATVLQDIDKEAAARIGQEAGDYLLAIRRVLKECVTSSPVTRLRDNTGVPSVPPYVGLRGLSSDVEDSVDPDVRHGYAYDSTLGPFHLLKCEVLEPDSPETGWMLDYLEDRFFMFSPLRSRIDLSQLSIDWFNLGGFEKLQPYYVHYQDAYLQRDEIPSFLRGFFNTLCSIADPMTLTFQEELDEEFGAGGEPHKTHEEAWFFQQLRSMLVMEMKDSLFLARGTPREWLQHGKRIAVRKAPTYFGPLSYSIESRESDGKIEATIEPPKRQQPKALYLRLRHPRNAPMKSVKINGKSWTRFDAAKEWIEISMGPDKLVVTATY